MTPHRRSFLVALLLIFALCFGFGTQNLLAQGTDLGTIRGTVTDVSGAVVAQAEVEIIDLATHTSRHYKTNSRGDYEASALQSGRYQVKVTAPGFGANVINGIVLAGTTSTSANAVLRASADSTVQVSSEAGTINTEDQTISETLSPKAVVELPRDSRDIYQFLYINPNITQGAQPGSFKFIGGQSYGASFSVDGQRANGGIFGQQTQSQPSLESVGELNVLSNAFSAEYAGVANIRVNTKRGGDQYHGSLFYNNSNSALSAWTLADKANLAAFAPTPFQSSYSKSRFNITDAGASFGGPIPRLKKTWFFLAYERNWSVNPSLISNQTGVPHPSLWGGDFSLVSDSAKPAVPANVTLSASEIANNTVGGLGKKFIKIPQRLLNPATTKLISLYYPQIGLSAPINALNGRIPNYSTSVKGTNGQNMGDLRIDHDFNESNRLYGVYHGSSQSTASAPVSAPYTGLGLLHNDRLNSTVSLSFTHVFSPRLVNEARGGFNRQNFYTHSNTTLQSFLESIGFSSADVAAYGSVVGSQQLGLHGNPSISFGSSGFTKIGSGGRSSDRSLNQNLITFGDTLTWSIGRHNVKVGADFVRNQAVDGFAASRGSPLGSLAYSGSGTTPFANFLLGQAPTTATYVALPRPAMDVYNWENGYYVQDDFRVTSRLTLNLGMRYDTLGPYTDKNDLLANFDPNYSNPATGQKGRFIIPSAKAIPYLSAGLLAVGVVTASESGLGVGRGLVRPDRSDFGPRVGGAYRLTSKNVIRGGFGLYYPTSSAHIYRDPIATNPFSQAVTKRNGAGAPSLGSWPISSGGTTGNAPITGGVISGFGNTPSANYVPVDLKNPRVYQWNATFEQELGHQSSIRLSYIGARQTGQIVGVDLDMIPPSDQPFGTSTGDGVTPCDPVNNGDCNYSDADNARIKFPLLGDFVTGFRNFGHSFTSSFQAQAEHHSNTLTLSVAYTLLNQKSSGLDNGSDSLGGNAYNPFDPNSDFTMDSFTSRHRVVAYGIIDLPFGRGRRYAGSSSRLTDLAIGGWQASFNMFAKTGIGITPYWQCDDCDPITPGNVASGAISAVGGFDSSTFRPLRVGNERQSVAKGFQWNPAAFTVPTIGSDLFTNKAVVQRNTLIGPATYGVNLGAHKAFHLNERIAVQIGADVDNLFNHPMLSPDQNAAGGTFAQLGDFNLLVDQSAPAPGKQPKLLPISTDPNSGNLNINPNFGRLNQSFSQEGVSGNRTIRLRGRITF